MQFLTITTASDSSEPPAPELYEQMDKLMQEMSRAGVLIARGAFVPRDKIHLQKKGGEIIVTDGPFTEAKEGIVGWSLIEAKSKEEAVEYSKKFWEVAGDGEVDIYPMFDPG